MAATFHPFPLLPRELQDAIWTAHLVSEPPAPEVCIVVPFLFKPQPSYPTRILGQRRSEDVSSGSGQHNDFFGDMKNPKGGGPALPLTVDTSWPSIAHVCRSSREFFFRSLSHGVFSSLGLPIRLRHSKQAGGILMPYRLFNPETDTLYWSSHQHEYMTSVFLEDPNAAELAKSLRHIAFDISTAFLDSLNQTFLRSLIESRLPNLQSIKLVFPESKRKRYFCIARRSSSTTTATGAPADGEGTGTAGIVARIPGLEFVPPGKRCRLVKITECAGREVILDYLPGVIVARALAEGFLWNESGENMSFRKYLRADEFAELWKGSLGDVGKRLEVTTGVFEEWQFSDLGIGVEGSERWGDEAERAECVHGGRWVEVCGGRRLGVNKGLDRLRYISMEERRNSEEYRVHDDDLGMYGKEASERG